KIDKKLSDKDKKYANDLSEEVVGLLINFLNQNGFDSLDDKRLNLFLSENALLDEVFNNWPAIKKKLEESGIKVETYNVDTVGLK
ncbi:MAG: hypothetical protein QXG00_06655, partial [Candidatus Woesearchaeota archaeon]